MIGFQLKNGKSMIKLKVTIVFLLCKRIFRLKRKFVAKNQNIS